MQTELDKLAYSFRQKWSKEEEDCERCMPVTDSDGNFVLMSNCFIHIERREKYSKIEKIISVLDKKGEEKEKLIKEYVELVFSLENTVDPETLTELAAEDGMKEEIEKEIRRAIQEDREQEGSCFMD
jgi:VIT1/CCC1 family predicted Fe2+/Mn2+ transporter